MTQSYVMTSAFGDDPQPAAASIVSQANDRGISLRTWGDGYGYTLVATGRAEAMFDLVVHPWDVAPMPIIMGEAGGKFTDLDGRVSITSGNALASNGLLHDQSLELVKSDNALAG